MTNIINDNLKEIDEYLTKAKYPDYDYFAENSKPELFLKALKSGLAPNYILKMGNSIYTLEVNVIMAFFMAANLKQIQKEEKLFKENMNHPAFQGLLFTADMGSFKLKMSEKIIYLLNLGYEPNIIATPEMNINNLLKKSKNITPLHYIKNKKVLQRLLDLNADLHVKANVLNNSVLSYAVDKNIKQFHTNFNIDCYIKEAYKENYLSETDYNYLLRHNFSDRMDPYNQELKKYSEAVTPIELAKRNKEKGKLVLLEKYNKTKTPKEKVEEIKTLWINKDKKEALDLFLIEMKNENEILFENLLDFKDLILTTKNQNNMVNQMIVNQKIKWLDKVFDNNMSDDSFRGYNNTSYLAYAASKRKTTVFIHLYNKGINSGLDKFIESTKKWLDYIDFNNFDSNYNNFFPVLIVDFLTTKGYDFGGNKIILQKIVNFEKEKLEQSMATESEIKLSTKKIKV
jgi:hypothetical protein